MNWHLDWVGRVAESAGVWGEGLEGLRDLDPSQIFCHLKPRAIGGPLGFRQQRSSSSSSVRCGDVGVFVGLEQPANFGDVGSLDRGVDLVQFVVNFVPKTEVEFL